MIMLTLNWAVMGIVFFAACQDVSPADSGNVNRQLQENSDLNFLGHGTSYAGLVFALPTDFLWSIPTILDEPALARNGINLDNMALPDSPFHAGGVSRRSSLRFVLDVGGLAYFVDDNKQLVVTTKPLARVKWMTTLPRPAVEDLKAESRDKRREAAFAAGFYHLDPDVWLLPLVRALEDADRDVQFDSAFALGELGPQASDGINALITLLKSKDLTLREAATCALGKIGPKALVRLGELIYDPDPAIALAAIKAYGQMGSAGNEAVPELIAVGKHYADRKVNWDDSDYCTFCAAIASALSQIELGDAVAPLQGLLKSDSAGIRAFAANAIGEIGPHGQVCEPELQKLLSDGSIAVRRQAAYAMARIDLPSDTSTTALEAAAKDSDHHVTLWAKEALRVIKSKQ
jgi:HEAT repeat protein